MSGTVTLVTPAVGRGGGIASVSRVLVDTWPDGTRLRVVETGGASLLGFARAVVHLGWLMVTGQAGTLWIMLASRGSALRKTVIMLLAAATRTPYVVHVHGGGFVDFYTSLPRPLACRAATPA